MQSRNRVAALFSAVVAFAVLFSLVPTSAGARQRPADEVGVVVRLNGDAFVDAGQHEAAVVVIKGNAHISGTVDDVVVVDGSAILEGASVGNVVVVQGTADLRTGTTVSGDVELYNAQLQRAEGVTIAGRVDEGLPQRLGRGTLVFGILFALGAGIAVIVCGLVAAAIAPHGVRAAGYSLTHEFGKTAVAALAVWVGLPVVAVISFATVIGIPISLGIFVFVLPVIAFVGYLVTGIRLGDYLLGVVKGVEEAWHPYLGAIVGLASLLLMGALPVIGSVVVPLSAIFGAGAVALNAWKVARRPAGAAAHALD